MKNTIKQIIPNNKSPIALGCILEVDTFNKKVPLPPNMGYFKQGGQLVSRDPITRFKRNFR